MSPHEILAAARRAGLSGVAVCDHNALRGARAMQAACPKDFLIVPGAEYSTDFGHVLAYFITRGAEEADLPKLADGRFKLTALADFVKAQGGLLIAAHPYFGRDSLPAELLRNIHGLEVFNARQMARCPRSTAETQRAAHEMGGITTAGSDAHRPGEVGGAFIELSAETADTAETAARAAQVKQAMLSGRCACRGRPAKRRHEAQGRFGSKGIAGLPRDMARWVAFTSHDAVRAALGVRQWQEHKDDETIRR
ncbi:MAG: PHP domain-containing protein [Oscillospiraceae bacterium]|nr:PHP domain-containing protein [Oscillospiraceae bacterium]